MAHAYLGSLYYWRDNRTKGEEYFTAALNLLNRLTEKEKLGIKARIERFRGNFDEAVVHYGVYLRKYPNTSKAWFGLGYSYMRLDRLEKAIDAFNRSLEIFRDKEANTYINIATCYHMLQEYQQSIDQYLKAFELNPNLLTVGNLNHEFGFTYVQLGEYEKAMEVFIEMEEGQDEHKARGYRSQALLLLYKGKLSEAIEQLHKSTLIYKTLGHGLSQLRNVLFMSSAYKAKGMMKEYKMELIRTSEIINNDENGISPWWLFLLGKIYIRDGDIVKAEELLYLISVRINARRICCN